MKSGNLKLRLFGLLIAACSAMFFGCSQPVFESTECIASRDIVKSFYSFHIGNDMTPTPENLKKREKFLTESLKEKLRNNNDKKTDYFSQTDNYPKAFRAGKCKTAGVNKASFEILLFWRTGEENIQREIIVEASRENDSWLISKVSSEK